MNPLVIKETETSPRIMFDPTNQIFEISGESRPDDARAFFVPVIQWLEEYGMYLYWKKNELKTDDPLILEFKLEYFNSTSAKYILDVFYVMEKLHQQKHKVMIKWHYEAGDLDIKEAGEEFFSTVDVPHAFVEN